MNRDWKEDLKRFEEFLSGIDTRKYSHLRSIKTVEQDLPRELLPLDIFYRYYWETTDFKDYDEIFEVYWFEKLNPHIYRFIKKYFYECSLRFVEEGFKARLYRIWMSILTQFHFQYLWNSLFTEELRSSAELDAMGIDATVVLRGSEVGIQIKKVSYRREASARRFAKRMQRYVDAIVEVPYLVLDTEELRKRIANPRVKEVNRERYRRVLEIFERNFSKLDNGFVVFKESYLKHVHSLISAKAIGLKGGKKISYEEILKW